MQRRRSVPLYDGYEQAAQCLYVAVAHKAHHAEVEEGELSSLGEEEVSGMRVAVEEPVLKSHLEDRLRPHRRHAPTLGRGQEQGPDVEEAGPLDKLHRDDPLRGEVGVDFRDLHGGPGEVGSEATGVLDLLLVVELAPDHTLELGNELLDVDKDPIPEPRIQERRQISHQREIRLHAPRSLRPLHLYRDLLATVQPRPVDLADTRRPEPHRVELGEYLLGRNSQLSLYNGSRYLQGHRCHLVLKLLELGEYALGDDVRAGTQELAELDERRSQIVQGPPEPDGEVWGEKLLDTAALPPVAPDVEDEPEAVAYENAPDLGEPCEVLPAAA